MKTYSLPLETQIEKRANVGIEISYSDLTAAGNTQTLSPITVDALMGAEIVSMELVTPFVSSDGTLISTSITIGDGGSATRFLSATELNSAGTYIAVKGGTLANTSAPYQYTVADTVDVFVTGTGGKALNTHTAGKVLIYARVQQAVADGLLSPTPYTNQ